MDLTAKSYLRLSQGMRVLWGLLATLTVLSLLLWLLPVFSQWLWALRLPEMLSLRPTLAGLTAQPWGIFTYSLVHQSLLHLLGNLVLLYYAGRMFLGIYSLRFFACVLISASLLGGLLYILAYQLISVLGLSIVPYGLLGASASAYALLFAVARSHDQQLVSVGPYRMSLMRFAVGLLAVNTLLALGNFGGHMSHLGGVLVGLLFSAYMSKCNSCATKATTDRGVSKAEFDKALKGIRASGFYSLSEQEKQALLRQQDGKDE